MVFRAKTSTGQQLRSVYESPEFIEAEQLRKELQDRLSKISAEIIDLDKRRTQKDSLSDRAELLLKGQPYDTSADLRSELDKLYDSKRVTEKAITLQQQKVRAIQQDVTKKIVQIFQPEVLPLAKSLLDAVKVYEVALSKWEAKMSEIRSGGIESHIYPLWINRKFEQFALCTRSGEGTELGRYMKDLTERIQDLEGCHVPRK